jgi:hypothetical protein
MTTEQQEWLCTEPGCGASFNREQGLKRHRFQKHGGPPSPSTLARRAREAKRNGTGPKSSVPAPGTAVPEVPEISDERLEALAAPLKAELEVADTRLAQLDRELAEVKARIAVERDEIQGRVRPVRAALSALTREHVKPGPRGSRGTTSSKERRNLSGGLPVTEEKVQAVYDFIAKHRAEVAEGMTPTPMLKLAREEDGLSMHDSTFRLAL